MQNAEKLNQIKFYRKFYVREKKKVEYNGECEANQSKQRDYRPIKWTNNETNESIVMYYDYRGRRCGKLFYNSDGIWQESAKFFYNNFTLIEESTADNTITKEFVWDPIETIATRPLTMKCNVQNLNLLYTHDANKNVTEVLYLATANGLAAHYEYSPFGELRDFSHLSATPETSNSEVNAITETSNSDVNAIAEISNYGHLASSQSLNPETNAIAETLSPETNAIDYAYNSRSANPSPGDLIDWCDTRIIEIDIRTFNPFRFSSEYHDDELSLIYYNYRHYNPATARWISRDPIEEFGGINLYNMCHNNSINYIDIQGKFWNIVVGAVAGAVAGALFHAIVGTGASMIAGGAISGGVGNASGSLVQETIDAFTGSNNGFNPSNIGASALIGSVTGCIGGLCSLYRLTQLQILN